MVLVILYFTLLESVFCFDVVICIVKACQKITSGTSSTIITPPPKDNIKVLVLVPTDTTREPYLYFYPCFSGRGLSTIINNGGSPFDNSNGASVCRVIRRESQSECCNEQLCPCLRIHKLCTVEIQLNLFYVMNPEKCI